MALQFTNLLAAIDGSEGGWRALDAAIAMTRAAGGSLAAITVGVALSPAELAEFRRVEGDEADASEAVAERLLAEAGWRIDRATGKPPAGTYLRWGDPAEAIINTIAEEKFDAIVVGRRGRGRLAGLLLGSVSQKLASLAPCIVVVVP